jgi:hypothetical protein
MRWKARVNGKDRMGSYCYLSAGRVRTDPSVNSDPDRVETRLGPLEFFDGYPNAETVEAVYDNLDFQRGVRAFLDSLPIASLYAMREGLREVGAVNGTVGIFEELMDARTLFLTANTESVYAVTWLDLKDGPMVVESAPNTLGILDDFFFGHVTDLGNAGPDRGQGGKFLILPPGYEGEVPDGYYTAKSRTFGNWLIWRGFLEDGDPQPAVANLKANIRIYPLAQRERSARHRVRQPVGPFLQHHPRQRPELLRGGARGHPGRARRTPSIRSFSACWRPSASKRADPSRRMPA